MIKPGIKTALIVIGLTAIATQLTGCKVFGGIMVHDVSKDAPEYKGTNPLGFVRAETDDGKLFCQHISSIPDIERGYGLNTCGVSQRLY